jgi:RNA polymerase sigma-70 factor, ECF subfamily
MMPRVLSEPGNASALEQADDALLVARAQDGDRRAFAVLLRRHQGALRRYVDRLVRSRHDVEDVLQETAVIAWRRLDTVDDPARIRSWLIRIATREALRAVVDQPSHAELTEDVRVEDGADGAAAGMDLRRALNEALDGLPQQQARCWVLRELGGYTYAEIAERLGIPESTVRGSLAQARKSILIRMGGRR